MLSENLVGYKWSINENTWLNAVGIMLFLTLNVKDAVECLFGIKLKCSFPSVKASMG